LFAGRRNMYPKTPAPTSTTTMTATTAAGATPVPAIWGHRDHKKFKRIGTSIYVCAPANLDSGSDGSFAARAV
jgi:hypothetical protein